MLEYVDSEIRKFENGLRAGIKQVAIDIVQAVFNQQLNRIEWALGPQARKKAEPAAKKVVDSVIYQKVVEAVPPPEPVAPKTVPGLPNVTITATPAINPKAPLLQQRRVGDTWQRTDGKYPYVITEMKGAVTTMKKVGADVYINVTEASLKSKWRPL